MISWKNRHKCKTKAEAIEALSNLPKEEYEEIVSGGIGSAYFLKGQASEFAEIWGIPFSESQLLKEAKKLYSSDSGEEYEDYDCGWNASYC